MVINSYFEFYSNYKLSQLAYNSKSAPTGFLIAPTSNQYYYNILYSTKT